MANENLLRCVTLKAGADLSSDQFKGVYISADKTVSLSDGFYASGQRKPLGVLRNKPDTAGQAAQVQISGIGQVLLGGTVTAGQRICPGAAGTWIATPAGWDSFGVAISGGASGEIVEAAIFCEGGGSGPNLS